MTSAAEQWMDIGELRAVNGAEFVGSLSCLW